MKPVRNALGRGLSSLISTPVATTPPVVAEQQPPTPLSTVSIEKKKVEIAATGGVQFLSVDAIVNNPLQPRREFKEEELKELSDSIRTKGVLQPILVRPVTGEKGKYEIVAGERRWRAAKLSGLTQVPVVIRELDDRDALEISIIENIQRQELTPIEEAQAYERLAIEFKLGHQEIAERVGKNRASISNYLRLLKLPADVLSLVKSGELSMGHAKAILTIKEPSAQVSLARKVVNENLSVRQLEAIVSRVVVLDAGHRLPSSEGARDLPTLPEASKDFPDITDKLRNSLGTKVTIKHSNSGRGVIQIEYFSEVELGRIVDNICRE